MSWWVCVSTCHQVWTPLSCDGHSKTAKSPNEKRRFSMKWWRVIKSSQMISLSHGLPPRENKPTFTTSCSVERNEQYICTCDERHPRETSRKPIIITSNNTGTTTFHIFARDSSPSYCCVPSRGSNSYHWSRQSPIVDDDHNNVPTNKKWLPKNCTTLSNFTNGHFGGIRTKWW